MIMGMRKSIFCSQEVGFWASRLSVDFGTLGVDFWSLGLDFEPLELEF